jgi:hypothetical protein
MSNGFVKVKIAEPDEWMLKHHIVARQVLGIALTDPLPPNTRVCLHKSKETRGNPKPEDIYFREMKPKKERRRKMTLKEQIEFWKNKAQENGAAVEDDGESSI